MTTQDETKKTKLDNTKLYGYTIAGAGAIMVLVIVIMILYSLLSGETSDHAETKSITVCNDKWFTITTDPKKEILSLDPELEGVDWEVVVNGDFKNPLSITRNKTVQHLGNNTRRLDVRLLKSNPFRETGFILKRIPK